MSQALQKNPIAPGGSFSALSGAAIDQYNVVKVDSTEGRVIETSGTDQKAVGFMHTGSASAANEHVDVYYSGVVWARCVTTVTVGDYLETAADGEVQTAGTSNLVCGQALAASEGSDQLIPVLIMFFELAAS